MGYQRSSVPKEYDPTWLGDELDRIGKATQSVDSFSLKQWNTVPPKPRAGDIYYADGVNWNPGKGQGAYLYDGSNFAFMGFAGLAANSVTSTELADNAVDTAAVQNAAITLAKLANLTNQRVIGRNTAGSGVPEEVTLSQLLDWIGSAARGDLLIRGASVWARLGLGSNGQVLSSNGTDPVWSAPSGGITTIASGSLPAAATLSITNIPQTFSSLILDIVGASSNTATRHPEVRASTNNGSSYDGTGANYHGAYWDEPTAVWANLSQASLIADQADNVAAGTWNVTLVMTGYQSGPQFKKCTWYSVGIGKRNGVVYYTGSTNGINALQILWNGSGNFDAGTYALYGVN